MVELIRKQVLSPESDPCTLSNYRQFQVIDTKLDLEVFFDSKAVGGSVTYNLQRLDVSADTIILDTSHLAIEKVLINDVTVDFAIHDVQPPYGSPLLFPAPQTDSLTAKIQFKTTEKTTALQFIDGNTAPYLFSQCQAIHARSLFPCFDTPGVKSPYKMTVKSPYPCLMSGRPVPSNAANVYEFNQPIPIPSYLVALASGDIHSLPIGPRSAIYSELPGLQACQWEFERDMENFIKIAENLIFPYEWERYDALVLPLSFPYGGMENPNITFATPTLISGDRSQVRVMAHELAHSWSGNLVTNCSWEHFWLNEGWTVYLERRILAGLATQEAVKAGKSVEEAATYGEQVRHFSAIIGWSALEATVELMKPEFTSLVWDLKGKDPDDSFSRIPYEKGFNFLYFLETKFGIEAFNGFIKHYFTKYRYKSLDSYQFLDTIKEYFEPLGKSDVIESIDWNLWYFTPGLPPAPGFDTTLADACYSLANEWVSYISGKSTEVPVTSINEFEPDQHSLFLETLSNKLKNVDREQARKGIAKFIETYPYYASNQNGEILSNWNDLIITHGGLSQDNEHVIRYAQWLGTVGRMKFVRPGYLLLSRNVDHDFAVATFKQFEAKYHPICRSMVQKDLKLK